MFKENVRSMHIYNDNYIYRTILPNCKQVNFI